jgi:transcriptional regulator with XRE-family HTH domain
LKINLIIERLLLYFNVETNTALAQKLGVSASTLSNWKNRNTIDYELIFTKCEGVNFNWLFLGSGEMQLNHNSNKVSSGFMNEDPNQRIIRAQDETIETQRKFIFRVEDENVFLKKQLEELKPGEDGQKRKVV